MLHPPRSGGARAFQWAALVAGLLLQGDPAASQGGAREVGLSLFFQNGAMEPITLYGNPPRYLHEIDLITSASSNADEGIEPLVKASPLNWRGVRMVEEDWRDLGDGTFQRQRFYRNAAWMNEPSAFTVYATDAQGRRIGESLRASAGRDNRRADDDTFFIRRFVARQIARGCKSRSDCTGARFTAQQLVQVRHNRNPGAQAVTLPPQTTGLELRWSATPDAPLKVAVTRAGEGTVPFGYGFQVGLDVASRPTNGQYFVPGESVTLQVTFRDGQGRRLHQPGSLPTFGQFLRNENLDGLDYYDDQRLGSNVYYALKHREANILVALTGPTSRLRQARSVMPGEELTKRQSVVETVAVGGYTGLFTGVPSFAISTGGPARHSDPVPDTLSFTIPSDAMPGTYVAAVKGRRVFGGEAVNGGAVTTLQIGAPTETTFTPATGNCENCHSRAAALDRILHGIGDRRACFGCHMPLSFENDNALDYRVHAVHSRSRRVGADVQNCRLCHLTPPTGPARGLLPGAGLNATARASG